MHQIFNIYLLYFRCDILMQRNENLRIKKVNNEKKCMLKMNFKYFMSSKNKLYIK